MNPNDYDFWSVGNEQLSLQNHFPKHIPLQFLTHSGADSPVDNTNANNYTCAEPEILRRSLESALQCAHDEIEKYQLTLNENTAKKLLEATAQGAFRDDPNIKNAQAHSNHNFNNNNNNRYQQAANRYQQHPKEYKQSKLRLMELFVPPIREEENEGSKLSAGGIGNSSRKPPATINTTSPNKGLKDTPSYSDVREKRNTIPTILSSTMFQPPTPNEKHQINNENSLKPPIIPIKKENKPKYYGSGEIITKEELERLTSTSPTKGKSQSFSFPSDHESYTENEQSVTTIKSNINDELLQLLNKYYPNKNKSQTDLSIEENEEKEKESEKENEKNAKEENIYNNETEVSNEKLHKSNDNMKTSQGTIITEEEEEDVASATTSSTSSSDEKENIMKDSFLPSSINKKPINDTNNKQESIGVISNTDESINTPTTTITTTNTTTTNTTINNNSNNNNNNTNIDNNNISNKLSKVNNSEISDTSLTVSVASSSDSKSKSGKFKHKKSVIKNIFSPIHRMLKNGSEISLSRSSSRKSKGSNENISRSGSIINRSETNSPDPNEDESKYKCEEVLGKGANAVVKLAKSSYTGNIKNLDSEKFYAIKQFRKRRKNEPYKAYIKKVISEFCISSSLKHQNVVETVDLIQDKNENWCEVMEYCSGGDLYTRINTGTLTNIDEINCYFKQLLTGVAYLHSVGVCHRDLKPENLLMDETGTILKITDFGVSEVFRFPWEKNVVKRVTGLCGSEPYIAPEEWSEDKDYDPIKVDIWACAIVYYTMNHMSVPWRQANAGDKYYEYYLNHITNFSPIEELPKITHEVLYHMLDPNPETRWSMDKIIGSEWIQGVTACGGEAYKGKGKVVSGDGHLHTSKWRV